MYLLMLMLAYVNDLEWNKLPKRLELTNWQFCVVHSFLAGIALQQLVHA